MEQDKICQNCCSFFQDSRDFNTDFGICFDDGAFEPYLDEIVENADFSKCYDMYQKKRFDGGKEACDQYEEPEIIEIPDDEKIEYKCRRVVKYTLISRIYVANIFVISGYPKVKCQDL